jgi:hypothetical protein
VRFPNPDALFDAAYGAQSASTTHYPTFPNPTAWLFRGLHTSQVHCLPIQRTWLIQD